MTIPLRVVQRLCGLKLSDNISPAVSRKDSEGHCVELRRIAANLSRWP